jgi:ArsR family transcriptional regulator, arsenate/arsenite/antimonite-responsive transcriptional repressor
MPNEIAAPLTPLDGCSPVASFVDDQAADQLATMFRALADPARVKIMSMLLNAGEVCACDVADGIGKSAGTASHHLKLLRDAGLIAGDKRGTWIYYRALPGRLGAIRDALAPTFSGAPSTPSRTPQGAG